MVHLIVTYDVLKVSTVTGQDHRDQYRFFRQVQIGQNFCGLALEVRNKLDFHGLTLNQTVSGTIVSLFGWDNHS